MQLPLSASSKPASTDIYKPITSLYPSANTKKPNQSKVPVKQVSFDRPFSATPTIAIIGGGASGLACAQQLAFHSIPSVVFDTGEHGVGGRLATRSSLDASLLKTTPSPPPLPQNSMVFDHAAQYIQSNNPAFINILHQWERKMFIKEWKGTIGSIEKPGTLSEFPKNGDSFSKVYVAEGGMRQLATNMSTELISSGLVEIRRPQWVSNIYHDGKNNGWRVEGKGRRKEGLFDAVVIAHNGKCANRLTAPMGVPDIHRQLKRLKLSANWVVMVAFERPVFPSDYHDSRELPPFEGAHVDDSNEVLLWAGNNTKKLGMHSGSNSNISSSEIECWTLLSTNKYGKLNKVPQEAVPAAKSEQVIQDLLTAFQQTLSSQDHLYPLPPVLFSRAQLWGAALPLNSPYVPCIWDGRGRVGICGDWVAGRGSVESAVLSGIAVAEEISKCRGLTGRDMTVSSSVGLDAEFHKIDGEDIIVVEKKEKSVLTSRRTM
jgi:predicted NAD/FAD-dependent oxidoreductase